MNALTKGLKLWHLVWEKTVSESSVENIWKKTAEEPRV